ncbi:hypothetical protein ACCS53_39345, partial [Rhizobium ruizarguesonis]
LIALLAKPSASAPTLVISVSSDTDIKNITDTDTKTVSDSNNTSDSFKKTDTDFAVIEDVKDFDKLGVAGHDLTFNLG